MSLAPAGGLVLQVAHVVRNLDTAIARWVDGLGAGPFLKEVFRFEDHVYRGAPAVTDVTVAVGALGDTLIELVCPNNTQPSIFNEVLTARGEGLHHYWMACADLDAQAARFAAAGYPQIGGGAMRPIGRCAYIDTTRLLGCFVELIDMRPAGWDMLSQIKAAHAGWDKSDPVRPYPQILK